MLPGILRVKSSQVRGWRSFMFIRRSSSIHLGIDLSGWQASPHGESGAQGALLGRRGTP